MSKIAVLGAGYVGITSAACFAHLGHEVIVSDISETRILMLQEGKCPIVEEGLPRLLSEGIANGKLQFTTDNDFAVSAADFVFVCLPTPQGENGVADISFVQEALSCVSKSLKPDSVVVTKSTVPVGSTKIIEEVLNRIDIAVVSNPEFLREGTAVSDFLNPDRVVVGSADKFAAERVAELYLKLDTQIFITDPASAETIKYAANAFLATKISYINAVAAVCEGVGADVLAVIEGIGSDKRIGRSFLNPGPGWGGSCFPKDTKALVKIAEAAGYDFALLRGVIDVNEQQYGRITQKILDSPMTHSGDLCVCVLGLTFKAGTDDLRDSPSLIIIRKLQDLGALIQAYDPTVHSEKQPINGVIVSDDAYSAANGADVIAVLTEWPEFVDLKPLDFIDLVKSPNVVDARNILNRESWLNAGFRYRAVGR
jgi:UDPglucose 6-dehydrogenase